jgi:cytochrome c
MPRLGKKLGIALAFLVAVTLMAALGVGISAKEGEKKPSGDVAKGQTLFKQNCELCHYADRTDKKLGPGLKGLFSLKELPSSHKPMTEENVRAQMEAGSPNAKPMPMPPFKDKLKPAEMDALIAYLKTL